LTHSIILSEKHFILCLRVGSNFHISHAYPTTSANEQIQQQILHHLTFFLAHAMCTKNMQDQENKDDSEFISQMNTIRPHHTQVGGANSNFTLATTSESGEGLPGIYGTAISMARGVYKAFVSDRFNMHGYYYQEMTGQIESL